MKTTSKDSTIEQVTAKMIARTNKAPLSISETQRQTYAAQMKQLKLWHYIYDLHKPYTLQREQFDGEQIEKEDSKANQSDSVQNQNPAASLRLNKFNSNLEIYRDFKIYVVQLQSLVGKILTKDQQPVQELQNLKSIRVHLTLIKNNSQFVGRTFNTQPYEIKVLPQGQNASLNELENTYSSVDGLTVKFAQHSKFQVEEGKANQAKLNNMIEKVGATSEMEKMRKIVDDDEKRKNALIKEKMRTHQNEVMFLVDKEEVKEVLRNGLQVAVEVTGQIQKDPKSKPKQISLGYAIVKIIDQEIERHVREIKNRFTQESRDVFFLDYRKKITSGSLRDYFFELMQNIKSFEGNAAQKKQIAANFRTYMTQPAELDLKIQEATCETNLMRHIPTMTLFGADDLVPGFQNKSTLRYLHGQGIIEAVPSPKIDIYLYNLNIVNLKYLMMNFSRYLDKQFYYYKYHDLTDKIKQAPQITRVYLKVNFHNTWKLLNAIEDNGGGLIKKESLEIDLIKDKKYERDFFKVDANQSQKDATNLTSRFNNKGLIKFEQLSKDKFVGAIIQLHFQVKFEFASGKNLLENYCISEALYLPFNNKDHLEEGTEKSLSFKFFPSTSLLDGSKFFDFGYFASIDDEDMKLIFSQSSKSNFNAKDHSYWETIKSDFLPTFTELALELDKPKSSITNQKNAKTKTLDNLIPDQAFPAQKLENKITEIQQEASNDVIQDNVAEETSDLESQFSEFLLQKEDDKINEVQVLIDEIQREMQQNLFDDPSVIKENSYLRKILNQFIDYSTKQEQYQGMSFSSTKNIQALLDSLPPERFKFIIEFLVSLVLKNFKASKLIPNLKNNESLLLELLNYDPNYRNSLKTLISQQLSEVDKLNLLKLGIGTEILDPLIFNSKSQTDLYKDLMRRFNSFNVEFHFIGFKTPKFIYEDDHLWPNQMAFRFQFYHFETIQTHLAQLKRPLVIGNQPIFTNAEKIESDQLYIFKRLDTIQTLYSRAAFNDEIVEEFKISEPAAQITGSGLIYDTCLNFIEFLCSKSLAIEIFDMNSQFLFGVSKLDLSHLLIESREKAFQAKTLELEVCDPNTSSILGSLQIHIKNIASFEDPMHGLTPQDHLDLTTKYSKFLDSNSQTNQEDLHQVNKSPSQSQQKWNKSSGFYKSEAKSPATRDAYTPSKHKKKVASKPLEQLDQNYLRITSQQEAQKILQINSIASQQAAGSSDLTSGDQEIRKKARVEKLKMQRQQEKEEYERQIQASIGKQDNLPLKKDVSVSRAQKRQKELSQQAKIQLYYQNKEQERLMREEELKKVEIVRKSHKNSDYLLNQALYEGVDFKLNVDAMPGRPQYFDLMIKNRLGAQELFKVLILDPDREMLDRDEIILVKNGDKHLENLVSQGKALKPQKYNLISESDDFLLEPGEQTPITFRFLTFRPVAKITQQREVQKNEHKKLMLTKRRVTIKVISRDETLICHMQLTIMPRHNYCDHKFIYYMPADDTLQNLEIQNFLNPNTQDLSQYILQTSSPKFKARFQDGFKAIILTYKASKQSDRMSQTQLFIYEDQFFAKLIATVSVEIYFLDTYRVKVPLRVEGKFQLSYKPTASGRIEIHCSHPKLVKRAVNALKSINLEQIQEDEGLLVQKQVMLNIPLTIQALELGVTKCLINCVNITRPSNKFLQKAWIIEVEGLQALAKLNYELTLLRNTVSIQTIAFQNVFSALNLNQEMDLNDQIYPESTENPLQTRRMKLQFVSSRPQIVQVQGVDENGCMSLDYLEKKDIEIQFNSYTGRRDKETFMLYVTEIAEENQNIDGLYNSARQRLLFDETIKFEVKYI